MPKIRQYVVNGNGLMGVPARCQGVKKRGRGRPVIYQGDPDAPGLDPAQRRLLQRRISNRESARRTRKRHQEHAESLYAKVCLPKLLLLLVSELHAPSLEPQGNAMPDWASDSYLP